MKLETEDEIQVTADHSVRPIIVPRDVTALPWSAGYAETINAGKSRHNEDQARVAKKNFKDFDAFRIGLPLKERFFLLKPNVLSMSMRKLICNDHRSSIDIHKTIGLDNTPSA